jgi:hypothetical protein
MMRTANFEKSAPEWDAIEIICPDDSSEHYVHRPRVDEATSPSVPGGRVLLRLDGTGICHPWINCR